MTVKRRCVRALSVASVAILVLGIGADSSALSPDRDTSGLRTTSDVGISDVIAATTVSPTTALSPAVQAPEVKSFCAAVATCLSLSCDATGEELAFSAIQTETPWGAQLRDHLIDDSSQAVGSGLIVAIRVHGLHYQDADCLAVYRAYR